MDADKEMIGESGCQETAVHQHGDMDISAVRRRRQECVVVTRYWAPTSQQPNSENDSTHDLAPQ